MGELVRFLKKNPAALIGTAAVIGLALGSGVVPLPGGLGRLSPAPAAPPPSSAPAAPPPPPDPLDNY